MTTFPMAPMDSGTKIMTLAYLVVLFGVALVIAMAEADPRAPWITFALAAVAAVLGYGFAPRQLEVAGSVVRVRRRIFGARTHTAVGPAARASWRLGLGSLRLLGMGGAWGWYGLYWRSGFGRYRAAVTDRARLVVVPTDAHPLVVSPADPEGFVRAMAKAAR